ncbi:MAG: glycoside hydrolase family 32 protein, partial [Bacteroidales bacterium]|nr:glycoside hydrolase family 32 protein [Bacteroidales bacterium]
SKDRVVAVPWMSNWQYGAIVPTKYFRSANSFPRVLGLYKEGKEFYVSVNPVAELSVLEKETTTLSASVNGGAVKMYEKTDGAYEINAKIASLSKGQSTFRLSNDEGEYVDLYFDGKTKRFVMDRTKSGIVDFGENSTTHEIENHDRRKTNSMNYVNDFALATWAPINLTGSHNMQVLCDNSSLEIFVDGGKIAMTNLVFPTSPYNKIELISDKGDFVVTDLTVTRLEY